MAYEELIARLGGWRAKLQSVGGYDNGLTGIPADGVRKIIDDAEQAAAALRDQAREIERLSNDLDFCTQDLHEKYQADLQREGDHYRALLADVERDTERLDWIEEQHGLHRAIEFHYLPVGAFHIQHTYDYDAVGKPIEGETFREAIDAAMEPK